MVKGVGHIFLYLSAIGISFKEKIHYLLCVCMPGHMCRGQIPFHHESSKDQTQVIRLGGRTFSH